MKTKIQVSRISSAEIVASVDDLLLEIFLHLPMKSLIRFKSVSKHWRSLISDPRFCILHNPDPKPAVGLFLRCHNIWASNPGNGYEYVPFSGVKNPPFRKLNFTNDTIMEVVQSCNGLLLCSGSLGRGHSPRNYVYNPTTNKYSKLPKLDQGISWMFLAFEPAKSPHYKVVCVHEFSFEDITGYEYEFEVHSSETGSWRKCGEPFTAQVNFRNGVYWNGSIHWISYRVDLSNVVAAYPEMTRNYFEPTDWYYYAFSIFSLVRGKKDEDSFLVLQIPGKAIRYNTVYQTFETIHEFEGAVVEGPLRFSNTKRFQYIESLCCV